jgi:hypothetical protein
MDSSLWPAALFGFVFVLMGVLRLARTPFELGWGLVLACAMAAGVLFLSPVALVPVGLLVVSMGWWRESGELSKKRPDSPVQHMWNPTASTESGTFLATVVDGFGQGAAEAQSRGLVPWKPPVGTATEQAESLAVRAQRNNPFRPEGALGHRTGVAMARLAEETTGVENLHRGPEDGSVDVPLTPSSAVVGTP